MHANAPETRKKLWHEKWFMRSGYFLGAILLHLIVFLMVATLIIWKAPPPPPTEVFHGVPVKITPPPVQPPASGAQANNPQFEPQPVVVPVVTPPSVITAASSTFSMDVPKVMDQTLSHLSDQLAKGTGLSSGGGGNAGNGSGYGSAKGMGNGLVGIFYDLKQTPDNKPTDIADPHWLQSAPAQAGLKFLRSFVKTWDMSMLDDYFKAPQPLYADQIAIPVSPSPEATKAYHVDGTVRARRWIVVYEAKIEPPDSGKYRFIGFADDFMVVRINGNNVLDASWAGLEELDPSANVKEDVGMGPEGQHLLCGSWFYMSTNDSIDMQVLIGEGPGGFSGFLLMVQKEGDTSPKGDYPVFQLQDVPVPDIGSGFNFSKKKMLFQVGQ